MKKIIILAATAAFLFTACRQEADYHPYIGESGKLAYNTYTEQFEYIWKCMSMGYVFWDVDNTDWDAAYRNYLPKFQELDRIVESGGTVPTSTLAQLYEDMMGGMKDHHMYVRIRNLFPAADEMYRFAYVQPGDKEVSSRDYFIESASVERQRILDFLGNIESQYGIAAHETATYPVPELGSEVTYVYCLIVLPDGRKIPYLWQSLAAITPVVRSGNGNTVVEQWLKAIVETPHNELAGIILDNRDNRGGYQDDLDYLVGSFLNERTEIFKTRYKEGPGRLEHSVWTPYYIEPNKQFHRDITAENIPYVVICDINSVSMGEIEPMTIKAVLPTAHTIGERTYGGTGPLQPAEDVNLNYGGPFGDNSSSGLHYIYTSSFEAQIEGKVMEGLGHTPDQVILRKDYNGDLKPQLDAAIQYIMHK